MDKHFFFANFLCINQFQCLHAYVFSSNGLLAHEKSQTLGLLFMLRTRAVSIVQIFLIPTKISNFQVNYADVKEDREWLFARIAELCGMELPLGIPASGSPVNSLSRGPPPPGIHYEVRGGVGVIS